MVAINLVMLNFVDSIEAIKLITVAVEEALHFISAGRFPHNMPHLTSLLEPPILNASSFRQTLGERRCRALSFRRDGTRSERILDRRLAALRALFFEP